MAAALFDTVWINGSVGAGKTTAADRLGDELERRGVPGAVIDVDWLRRSWPAPADDPFGTELALANARAVAANFRACGALVVVAAGVVETADEAARGADALGATRMLLVRLTVDAEVAGLRLRRRHDQDESELQWHLRRHPQLARMLERAGFGDELLIDTTALTADDVARTIADRLLGGVPAVPSE